MSKTKYNLICVAHPDDETLFFGGLIQRRRTRPWRIICLTDGNADQQGHIRKKQFQRACSALGVEKAEWWGYPDQYDRRLPVEEIAARLKSLTHAHEIFTHGITGEYGHPHHQDVCFAVHQAFRYHPRLYAVAYNGFPELRVQLNEQEYELKTRILARVYGSETNRFLNMLPATYTEGFLQLSDREVKALYDYFAHGKALRTRDLKVYRWLVSHLRQTKKVDRPF